MRVSSPSFARSTFRLPPLPSLSEILRIYQVKASKRLSQNFLLDQNLTKKLVRESGKLRNAYVVEVGPGTGSITRQILAQGPRKLLLVEKDRRFVPILTELKHAAASSDQQRSGFGDRVEIVRGDILNTRLDDVFPPEAAAPWDGPSPSVHVIGNLPFAISTPLLIKWLEDMSNKRGIFRYGRVPFTLTFQKEVAQRMVASIAQFQRCRLSVICQCYADVSLRFVIPGRAFIPPPEVDVGVVTVVPKIENNVPEVDFRTVEKVVRNLFQFRQKHVKNCIERLFPPRLTEEMTYRILQQTGIEFDSRPFYVSNEEIRKLCLAYQELCLEAPSLRDYSHVAPAHERVPLEAVIEDQYHGRKDKSGRTVQ